MNLKRLFVVFLILMIHPCSVFSQENPMVDGVPNVLAKPGLDTSRRIEMTCGGTRVEIICGYNQNFRQANDRICSDNTLIFTLPDGKAVLPHASDSLVSQEFTPISISCRREHKNPGSFYIYTRYLNASYNCHKCDVEVIYSLKGERIRSSDVHLESHGNTISIEERTRNYPDDYLYKKED